MEIKDKNKRVLPLHPLLHNSIHLMILVSAILLILISLVALVIFLVDDIDKEDVLGLISFSIILIGACIALPFGIRWLVHRANVKKHLKDCIKVDAKIRALHWCTADINKGPAYVSLDPVFVRVHSEIGGVAKIKVTFNYNGEKVVKYSGIKKYNDFIDSAIKTIPSQKRGYHVVWKQLLELKDVDVLYSPKYDKVFFLVDENEIYKKNLALISGVWI